MRCDPRIVYSGGDRNQTSEEFNASKMSLNGYEYGACDIVLE